MYITKWLSADRILISYIFFISEMAKKIISTLWWWWTDILCWWRCKTYKKTMFCQLSYWLAWLSDDYIATKEIFGVYRNRPVRRFGININHHDMMHCKPSLGVIIKTIKANPRVNNSAMLGTGVGLGGGEIVSVS